MTQRNGDGSPVEGCVPESGSQVNLEASVRPGMNEEPCSSSCPRGLDLAESEVPVVVSDEEVEVEKSSGEEAKVDRECELAPMEEEKVEGETPRPPL